MSFMFTSLIMTMFFLGLVSATGVVRLDFGNGGYQLVNAPIDQCQTSSYLQNGNATLDLDITSNCTANADIRYNDQINLTFGPVRPNEVQTGENWVYVNSALRPDLDQPAVVTFTEPGFVIEPVPLRNGIPCNGIECNLTFFNQHKVTLKVGGFSNYSLTGKQDFAVYDDPQPELKTKTYQIVDLGANNVSRRAVNYTCIVSIFGRNENLDWVLVQTNPTRDVQARMFGSPDSNQPESLGYFPTVNGIANTYFRGDTLSGYEDFELVIQCASSNEKLIYEEPISTRYSPLGRTATGRGIWVVQNGFWIAIYFFGGLIVLFVVIGAFRRIFRR